MSWSRRTLVGVAAAALLTGCTSTVTGTAAFGGTDPAKPDVPPASLGGPDPSAEPVVGTCRMIASGQENDPRNPPDPVECSTTHNAETAAVADSGVAADALYPTADDVGNQGSDSYRVLDDVCTFTVLADYLGGDTLDDPYAFFAPYLPSAAQWDAGARWVRCDVFYGYSSPETSPGILAGALQGRDAAAYRACFVGNPADWRVVPCSQSHDAEPIGAYANANEGDPYPADAAARQALAQQCASDVQAYVGGTMPLGYALDVYVGSDTEWAGGPLAQCVLVPAGGGQTSTSVRG
jgi:hypothetical protein